LEGTLYVCMYVCMFGFNIGVVCHTHTVSGVLTLNSFNLVLKYKLWKRKIKWVWWQWI